MNISNLKSQISKFQKENTFRPVSEIWDMRSEIKQEALS